MAWRMIVRVFRRNSVLLNFTAELAFKRLMAAQSTSPRVVVSCGMLESPEVTALPSFSDANCGKSNSHPREAVTPPERITWPTWFQPSSSWLSTSTSSAVHGGCRVLGLAVGFPENLMSILSSRFQWHDNIPVQLKAFSEFVQLFLDNTPHFDGNKLDVTRVMKISWVDSGLSQHPYRQKWMMESLCKSELHILRKTYCLFAFLMAMLPEPNTGQKRFSISLW